MKKSCPSCVSVSETERAIAIRGRLRSGTAVVLVLLGMAIVAGLLFVTISPRAEANPRNAVAVLLSAGALLGAVAAALAMRVERLSVGGEEIVQEKSLGGIRIKRRTLKRADVDAVRVQARGAGGRGLAIIGPKGRLLAGSSLEEPDLEWLHAWISRRLSD